VTERREEWLGTVHRCEVAVETRLEGLLERSDRALDRRQRRRPEGSGISLCVSLVLPRFSSPIERPHHSSPAFTHPPVDVADLLNEPASDPVLEVDNVIESPVKVVRDI
jgi:hypothetical protein